MNHPRYCLTRLVMRAAIGLLRLTVKSLPVGHPSRVFVEGRLEQVTSPILKACRPYAFCLRTKWHRSSLLKRSAQSCSLLLFLDCFNASPINLGLMPSMHIFTRMGAPDLAAQYGHHILTLGLPY